MKKIVLLLLMPLSLLLMSFNALSVSHETLVLPSQVVDFDSVEFERGVVARNMQNIDNVVLNGSMEIQTYNYVASPRFWRVELDISTFHSGLWGSVTENRRSVFIDTLTAYHSEIWTTRFYGTQVQQSFRIPLLVPNNYWSYTDSSSWVDINSTNNSLAAHSNILHFPNEFNNYVSISGNSLTIHALRITLKLPQDREDFLFNDVSLYFEDTLLYSFGVVKSGVTLELDFLKELTRGIMDSMIPIFDRRLDTSVNLSLSFQATQFGNNARFYLKGLDVGFKFRTTHEFILNSFLFNFGTISSQNMNVSFNLYDRQSNILNVVQLGNAQGQQTTLDNHLGVRMVFLPNRIREIFGFSLNFNTLPILESFQLPQNTTIPLINIVQFNAMNINELVRPPIVDNPTHGGILPNLEFRDCALFNVFCHIQNAVTWFLIDFTPIALIWRGIDSLLIMFFAIGQFTFSLFGYEWGTTALVSNYFTGTFFGMILSFAMIFAMWRLFKIIKGAM